MSHTSCRYSRWRSGRWPSDQASVGTGRCRSVWSAATGSFAFGWLRCRNLLWKPASCFCLCSIKYFSKYSCSLCGIWWELAACSSFVLLISDHPFRSATDKQQDCLVYAENLFFISQRNDLHQLSVMSCQESRSSKERVRVPTLHFTSQRCPRTGVFSPSWLLNFLTIHGGPWVISRKV